MDIRLVVRLNQLVKEAFQMVYLMVVEKGLIDSHTTQKELIGHHTRRIRYFGQRPITL